MLFGLDIETIIQTVYRTPISDIIFYYFALCILVSIATNLIKIDLKSLEANFGLFKIGKHSVPSLLFLAWFGLCYQFILRLELFNSGVPNSLFCVLVFIAIFILFGKIIENIQVKAVATYSRQRWPDINAEDLGQETGRYKNGTRSTYNSLLVDFLLVFFCLIFSFIQFGFASFLLICILSIFYLTIIVEDKIKNIRDTLKKRNW